MNGKTGDQTVSSRVDEYETRITIGDLMNNLVKKKVFLDCENIRKK